MAPRKRTESKHTPPTSPTASTSPDHHLRHTGPSIGTRARTGTASSKPPSVPTQGPEVQKGTHENKSVAEASRTPFSKFIYALLISVLLLFAWYLYGMVTLLERLKGEIGWWSLVVGDAGAEAWRSGSERFGVPEGARRGDLEGSLSALADLLGISPVQVASAVKPLVPQASLTNIALKADASGSSEAVRILIEDTTPRVERRTAAMDVGEDEGKGGTF